MSLTNSVEVIFPTYIDWTCLKELEDNFSSLLSSTFNYITYFLEWHYISFIDVLEEKEGNKTTCYTHGAVPGMCPLLKKNFTWHLS